MARCGVLVIDNLVAGRREFVNPRAEFGHADITASEDYLRRLLVEHRARFVFNYAAYPYIPVSFVRPLHVFNVNATWGAEGHQCRARGRMRGHPPGIVGGDIRGG